MMNRWEAFQEQLQRAALALEQKNINDAWRALERAHVLGQPRIVPHLQTHWTMLLLSLRTHDLREALGQSLRILLVVPGSLLGRLPTGNTGRAGVSAFQPMEVEEELNPFLV